MISNALGVVALVSRAIPLNKLSLRRVTGYQTHGDDKHWVNITWDGPGKSWYAHCMLRCSGLHREDGSTPVAYIVGVSFKASLNERKSTTLYK